MKATLASIKSILLHQNTIKTRIISHTLHSNSSSESVRSCIVSDSSSASKGPLASPRLKFRLLDDNPNNTMVTINTKTACIVNKKCIKATPLNPSSSRSHSTSASPLASITDIFRHPFRPKASVYKDKPVCKTQVPFKTNPKDNKNSAKKAAGFTDK